MGTPATVPIPQGATVSPQTVPIPSGASIGKPDEPKDTRSYLKIALDNSPSNADPQNPANPTPEGLAQMSPQGKEDAQSQLATGAAASAGGVGAVGAIGEVLPAVLPHTLEGVKAIGSWAEAHPVQAYMLYQVIKEMIPGAKKAMGIVKDVPTP